MKLQSGPGDLFDLAGETGLSPELLRLWQVHAGFPAAEHTEHGRMFYPEWQVRRLKLIRRLIALGEPPSRLYELEEEELAVLLDYRTRIHNQPPAGLPTTRIEDYVRMLSLNAFADAESAMQSHVIEQGLEDFVLSIAAPLCSAVGIAWEKGTISIAQEHIFSDMMVRTLRACSSTLFQPQGHVNTARPLVLLGTPPGEVHVLGLAMVETLLLLQDCRPLHIGCGLPEMEIVRIASEVGADIVAMSFSAAHHPMRTVDVLEQIDRHLPPQIHIWAGGANSGLYQTLPTRVRVFRSLGSVASAVDGWRRSVEGLARSH
ncbi:MerR family transcriptional regulator [Novosphingobium olei]|uniref:MerR family transcriptional regulator n=1 Tax=Novosphingobium olei TaxID=2728851 RepID=A0A7Y0G8T7_9SPHN|nr:MerR family transcriptional regulator [Novosphingobium olei]NML92184.1 MerR family transcriptional regulator [Novosphingobium olei]